MRRCFLLQACLILPSSAEREWRHRAGSEAKLSQLGAWTTVVPTAPLTVRAEQVAERRWVISVECCIPQAPFEFSAINEETKGRTGKGKGKAWDALVKRINTKPSVGSVLFLSVNVGHGYKVMHGCAAFVGH